ncbi:TetR/AcrR family transcriptional regulator [Natronospira bacteriovora]|uniref:TetR/AcrR family transcriptional regulator n=1 Tax=Natronospira bacteriovora TaxID=3069753 RepID=A0ABU0W8G4_9GAMM|nr:TetR/AcrR family transcriptional regulator [Natronospira sp. AB-CW4]MDQ2070329.1 TetR/AcrR family transcriptional regulator [Natronospira sp. AB-CW4]
MNAETQTRDPERTRETILEAASALFIEHGVSAVSMSAIARAANVTKSLIHHHFGSKAELWQTVKETAFTQYFTGQMAMLEEAEDPDPALLKASVEEYFRFLKDNPGVVRLFAWTHLEGDESCLEMDTELVALGAERIRQVQAKGLFRQDVNPSHVVATFVMTCTQWFEAKSHHQHWPGMGDDEAFLDDFMKLLLDGLRPRGSGDD